jgi:uncharacterized protein involved in exopolysaccharide biosynthesis
MIASACVVVFVVASVWGYRWWQAPYEAVAELRVRGKSDVEMMIEGGTATAADDRWIIAQSASQTIRSQTVLTAALGHVSIKNHPLIRQQVDPEKFVAQLLTVSMKQPGIILVRVRDRRDPQFCADLANAIVGAFISTIEGASEAQKGETIQKLSSHLEKVAADYESCTAEVEQFRRSLMAPDSEQIARTEYLKVEVEQRKLAADRCYQQLTAMLRIEGLISGTLDSENRSEMSKRLTEEYERNMNDLQESQKLLAAEQCKLTAQTPLSYKVDMQQHVVDRKRREIDQLSDMIDRLRLMREFGPRIEVTSPAQVPHSRERWIGWQSNDE